MSFARSYAWHSDGYATCSECGGRFAPKHIHNHTCHKEDEMSEQSRHPILDAPAEKQKEALEFLISALRNDGAFMEKAGAIDKWVSSLLSKLERMTDTRIPASREAYERIPHKVFIVEGEGAVRLETHEFYQGRFHTGGHNDGAISQNVRASCASLHGRCAFRPEDE